MFVLYFTHQHINKEIRHIHLIYKPISKIFRRGMTSLKIQNWSLLFDQYQQFNRENGHTNIKKFSGPKIICFKLYISTYQQGKLTYTPHLLTYIKSPQQERNDLFENVEPEPYTIYKSTNQQEKQTHQLKNILKFQKNHT